MQNIERKTHYKMYKSHKGWLIAGITVASMAWGITAGPTAPLTARADANTPATDAANTVDSLVDAKTATLKTDTDTSNSQPDTPTTTSTSVGVANTSTADQHVTTTPAEKSATPSTTPENATKPTESTTPVTTNTPQADATKSTNNPSSNQNKTPINPSPAATPNTPQPATAKQTATPVTESAPIEPDTTKSNVVPTTTSATQPARMAIQATAATLPTSDTSNINTPSGITVQDPSTLTDPVTGQPAFNISKTSALQYTYDHTDANGVSSDLRQYDGYSSAFQTQGAGVWRGLTYANSIPVTAKGVDTSATINGAYPYFIDEWMPDYAFQNFLWANNYAKKYSTINDFRNNFTKAELASLTSITTTDNTQLANPLIYQGLMSMKTLEGLQNATNLQSIYIYPNPNLSLAYYGNPLKNGNLWDIRALAPLKNLTKVSITLASINDITALGNKPTLTEVGLSYNQITDISSLATDVNLDIKNKADLANQHVLLRPITLNTKLQAGQNVAENGLLTYTTPSFIVKDLTAHNLPIKGFDNAGSALYPSLYPSTSDAGNVNGNTLSWYNLLADTTGSYGGLSTTWSDANSDFAGYIIQPYSLSATASSLLVRVQLLQADGNQLDLGPATVLSGESGDTVNVQGNQTVMTILNQQLSDGYTFSGLILNGTGLYSDYVAGNGLAHAETDWTTKLTDEPQNWTILFYKDVLPWNVTVNYGYTATDGTFTAITDADGQPITASFTGTSAESLALADYLKDFPDYVYHASYTNEADDQWVDISDQANIPFNDPKQTVNITYQQAKRAVVTIKDATTGATLQTLDYQTNPELRGAIGTTSDFNASQAIAADLANGYVLVSDTTTGADGQSLITFKADAAAETDYVITLAHGFTTTIAPVQETIVYQDKNGQTVAPSQTQTITFATVTDRVTKTTAKYAYYGQTTVPDLDVTGLPIDTTWNAYPSGTALTFSAVANPVVAEMHVIATTDPDNDLTQVTAKTITDRDADLNYVVTYDVTPHVFDTVIRQINEQIHYQDQTGRAVADTVTQSLTFATVTDQNTNTVVIYVHDGPATAPELNLDGTPVTDGWRVYDVATSHFAAVNHPVVADMHVVATTDPSGDLTKVVAQPVTPTDTDLTFTVTYEPDAHVFSTTTHAVHRTIDYQDADGQSVAPTTTQTVTFAIVTDETTGQVTTYYFQGPAEQPALDSNGQPIDLAWQTGTSATFSAVDYPQLAGFKITATTDASGNLIQAPASVIDATSQNQTITVSYQSLAHEFTTTTHVVHRIIRYQDANGQSVAPTTTQTITFATVTDETTGQITTYYYQGLAEQPALDTNGRPTNSAWVTGTTATLNAVTYPQVAGFKISATTDASNDLTQAPARVVDPTSLDQTVTVSYQPLAHEFTASTKQVSQQINYQNQAGQSVATSHLQTITFLTVTDQTAQTSSTYYYRGVADVPALDESGQPTIAGWTATTNGAKLAAVSHPAVTGMHVIASSEASHDLTQIPAQLITTTSANQQFTITYAPDTSTDGGNGGEPGDNGGTETEVPGNNGNNGGSETEQPGNNGNNGNTETEQPDNVGDNGRPETEQPGNAGNAGTTHGDSADKDDQVTTTARPANLSRPTNVSVATEKPTTTVQTDHVQVTRSVKPAAAVAHFTAQGQLPQTDEKPVNGLLISGIALISALAGAFVLNRRH
ncbi:mucin-binding protein [Lactiplantibacillus carotarum]|uniref:mucin-binding protein n=1 Tax=Lactiplantibacillus carotarum TaxID=2993456 RepID=UPI00298EDE16|nr:LPXTG cell wall anchor domain-containing protein [Lactiplantibacillus carotarum]